MRPRDFVILALLAGVIFYAWQRLQPAPIEEGPLTIDETYLQTFSKWSDNRLLAFAGAQTASPSGAIKGAESDNPDSGAPQTLLPVERYTGGIQYRTLDEMLKALNVTVYPQDIREAFPAPSLGLGSQITLYRATPVEVTDWGKPKTFRTWTKTVQQFLDEQQLELGDNDRIDPSAQAALRLDEEAKLVKIVITRVAITEVKQTEKIDFQKIEKEDPELPRGQTKVEKGMAGEQTKVYRVTRENGVEVKRELIKNDVTKEPKAQITVVSTKVLVGETHVGRASWYKYNSTKVASDHYKRGTNLRITNLANGKQIFVKNDGCICSDTGYVVDLHPDHFTALGGKISDGVLKQVKVEEILN